MAKQLERRLGRKRIALVQQDQTVHRDENLMNEDEIIRLPDGKILIFNANQEGFIQKVIPFYRSSKMRIAANLPSLELPIVNGAYPSIRQRLRDLKEIVGREQSRALEPQASRCAEEA
jgi:type IV secretory pathway TraG/TraD family ATPase VirD4